MATCKDCDGELQRTRIVGSSKRLDKNGRCPICAEIDAEATADEEATLEKAQRILSQRRKRKETT